MKPPTHYKPSPEEYVYVRGQLAKLGVRNKDDLDELTQASVARAWEKFEFGRGATFATYATSVAKNVHHEWMRDRRKKQAAEESEDDELGTLGVRIGPSAASPENAINLALDMSPEEAEARSG